MKYKIHKLIESKNPKRKAVLDNRIKNELNITDDKTNTDKTETSFKKPFYKTYRFFAGISTAVVAACLAIVLPIVGNNTQIPEERYCNASDCIEIPIEYSVKEYSEKNNLSYLYIDWYNIADEVQTKLFVNAEKPDDLIYAQEILVNGETGSFVVLSITDLYTKVDILEAFWNDCTVAVVIKGTNIYWNSFNFVNKAYFEYGNYRYFIELTYSLSDDYIFELIEGMLP